jgi:large conductance mechanosensitive channel
MKLSVKEMLSEFKAFAFKGNLIDLAVAVVIGTAFSSVIKSLVEDIIMPTVSYAVTAASTAAEAGKKAAEHVGETVGVTKPSSTQATTQPSTTQAAATQPSAAPPPAPVVVEVKPAEKPPEKAVDFRWTIGRINIGHFIGELINFIIIAFAVFLIVVKLLGSVMKRVGGTPPPSEPTTKECPKCLSLIPIRATKCPQCTADLPEMPPVVSVETNSAATG